VSSFPVVKAQVQAHLIPGPGVNPIVNVLQSGDVVTFNGSASHDDHKIVNYEWDLDGNGSFETHGITAKIEKKRFYSTGTFTIRLRVTDAQGLSRVVTHPVTIRKAPHAAISANVAVPLVGQQVTYSAAGSTGDPAIASYQWDLDGNGTFETDSKAVPTATMTYTTPGTITVRLRVTDSQGVQNTVAHALVVNPAPPVQTDTTAPKVTITPRSAKLSKKGIVTLRVSCPQTERSCAGRLSLTRSLRNAHTSKVGNGTFRIGGGQTALVRMHLSASNRKLVKRLHTLTTKATAIATDAAGNTATVKATVKIKR
jgi:hypothetical protein